MRKSLATPQGRRSMLGFGSAAAKLKKQNVPEQKKLIFSANKSKLHTSGVGVSGKRWSNQGTQSIKDTRPLSNRSFQKQMIEDILEFLAESGYPHPISTKVLGAPTSKEFLRVFQHLYGCLNCNFKMEKRFEEEVPRILKMLKYPFTFSKSAMFSIGSLHQWPTLLGALHWMVELIKTVNTVDMEQVLFPMQFGEEEFQKRHEKTFFDYYRQTYLKYMVGEDDFTDAKEKLQLAIISDAGCSEEDHEALKDEVARLEEELALLEAEPDPLEEAIKTKLMLEEKIEQDTIAIEELDQQNVVLNKQYVLFKQQFEEEGCDINQLGDHSKQKELKHKSTEVKTQLERFNSERERMEKQNGERELRYSRLYDQFSEVLNQYNDFVQELLLNPHIKNYLGENSIILNFDHNLTDISSINDNKYRLKTILNQLSSQVAEDCYQLESQIITEQDIHEKITEAIDDKSHVLMQISAQMERIDTELEEKKTTVEQEFTGTFQNIVAQEKSLENELKQIIQALNEDKHNLENKKTIFNEQVAHMRKEENNFIDLILCYCEKVAKYRKHVKDGILNLNECIQSEIDDVKKTSFLEASEE